MDKIFNEYVLILVWMAFIAFVSKQMVQKKTITVLGQQEQRYSWIFAFLVILPLLFMTANRTIYFGDTAVYRANFLRMPSEISDLPNYMETVEKDYGFSVFSILIKCFISQDPIVYFSIIALIQVMCLINVYRKHSIDYVLSVAIFILSSDYISWMYNGIRQFTAVTIIFAATTLMLKKKYIPVFAIIYFASLFHQSALIMIPIVIILQGKAWNKRTMLFIGLIIMAILFVGEFTNLLDSSIADTQYKDTVTQYTSFEDDGTNPIRVLIFAVPTIIAFIGRKEIIASENKLIHFCVNASLVSTGLYAVSIFTSGIFFGRVPIYVSLYNYILLPWEIKHIIPEHLQRTLFVAMIGFYLIFYYYQVSITWGLF